MKSMERFANGAPSSHKPKNHLAAVLLLFFLGSPGLLRAQFTYTITTSLTVTITGYSGPTGGMAVIPSSINGLPVTSIANGAFANSGLTNITLPYTVTNVLAGGNAFNCLSLTAINVDVNNPYYSSADGVFFDKSQGTLLQFPIARGGTYTIPDSVTNIGVTAFGNSLLTSVTIPDSVVNIDDYAFYLCKSLSTVTIGTNVAIIGNWAFADCFSLGTIWLPNSLTSLGTYAFWFSGLYSVRMSNKVKVIAASAFQGTSFTYFAIPDGVTEIGTSAFANCSSLTNVAIPNSVSKIGQGAFQQCGSLNNVTIPYGVTDVEDSAFYNCASMSSVAIPDSVTNLGASAFLGCSSLTNVTLGSGIAYLNDTFRYCTNLIRIIIPDSVTFIGSDTFAYCSKLTDVVIGSGVTNIWDAAFYSCSQLNNVYFRGNAPAAVSSAFAYADISIIHYLPGTIGWGPVFANRPAIPWVLPNPLILTVGPSFGFQNTGFGFVISWATNEQVVVEATENQTHGAWQAVSTNTLQNGWSYFNEPRSTNYPARFYRVRSL